MISILITHYNRLNGLRECLDAFKSLDLESIEYVVADDCSKSDVQNQLKKMNIDKLLLSDKNLGLASNLNRGIKACSGAFILYCQEDFIPKPDLKIYLEEAILLIENNEVDMCRLKSNYKFPQLINLSANFKLIPKFSWKNFYYNTFRYSDNPFITKQFFFNQYGYFLDNVSGAYGENEYAIRIMNSNARIAISNRQLFTNNNSTESVITHGVSRKKRSFMKKLGVHKFLRAVRFHGEFLMYNNNNRRLITLRNSRDKN